MTNNDNYQGWTNRETWALNLWLSNDEGLYGRVRDRVAQVVEAYREDCPEGDDVLHRVVGEAMEIFWAELSDPDMNYLSTEQILEMVRDIGSDYRVNWDEIGAAWVEDAS